MGAMEDVMNELFSQNVNVSYGQMYIELGATFDGDMENCFRGQTNGICGANSANFLFLMTGLHTGEVGLTINLFEEEPSLDGSWDEIVEVSVSALADKASIVEWSSDEGVSVAIPSGAYRARYHARNMQAGADAGAIINSDVIDTYRLDLWKAEARLDRIIKQTSDAAAYWHGWAANL